MSRLSKLLLVTVLMAPMAAMAAAMEPMGSVAVYATKTSVEVPVGDYDEKGTGFGVKGWVAFGIPFAHFEYQSTSGLGDDNSFFPGKLKVKQLRLGGGAALPVSEEVLLLGKLEYVKMDFDNNVNADLNEKGFGVHAGVMYMPVPALHFGATVGYLKLAGGDPNGNSLGDMKGLEYNLGAGYNFTKQWGAFVDYRKFDGKFDKTAVGPGQSNKWDVSDIRVGGTFNWGGK